MRAVVLGAATMAVLAGCGAQTRVVQLKTMTPSEAKNLVNSFAKPWCPSPRVLIHYIEPEVHGKGGEQWWCVEPAQAYHVVSRGLHCPGGTHLRLLLEGRVAMCVHSNRPTTTRHHLIIK